MTSSNGSPAELQSGGKVCPAGCGRYAHEMNFRFGASQLAADQRVAPRRAGPASAFLPLASQGIFSKDPGTAVSSLVNTSGRQPSLDWLRGLFLTRGAIDAARNIFVSRPELGGYPTDDGTESLHTSHHWRESWATSGVSSSEIRKVT